MIKTLGGWSFIPDSTGGTYRTPLRGPRTLGRGLAASLQNPSPLSARRASNFCLRAWQLRTTTGILGYSRSTSSPISRAGTLS